MLTALARFFRISLSRGSSIITLADELEHAKHYLTIQKMRYKNKFTADITVEPGLESLYTVKLIIQPILENAIYHGIKQKRGAGHILVQARREEDRLILRVEDDGAGMTQEKCDLLNAELSRPAGMEYDHDYGIFNVNDRIRLSYGKDYGLRYEINASGGITVILTCPAVFREDAGEEAEE